MKHAVQDRGKRSVLILDDAQCLDFRPLPGCLPGAIL